MTQGVDVEREDASEDDAPWERGLGFRPFTVTEALDTAVTLLRQAPGRLWSAALIGALPLMALVLGLEYATGVRRVFATSYAYDGLLYGAAAAVAFGVVWRGWWSAAVARWGLVMLGQLGQPGATSPREAIATRTWGEGISARVALAALVRVAVVWMGPLMLLAVVRRMDPSMDPELRVVLTVVWVSVTLAWLPIAGTLTSMVMPHAALEGRLWPGWSALPKALGLTCGLGALLFLLAVNLHTGVQTVLVLADALLGVDVSYWQRFCSMEHRLYTLVLACVTVVLIEPLVALSTTLLWVDRKVSADAVDLAGELERLRRSPEARGVVTVVSSATPEEAGDRERLGAGGGAARAMSWAMLGLSAVLAAMLAWSAPAQAQDQGAGQDAPLLLFQGGNADARALHEAQIIWSRAWPSELSRIEALRTHARAMETSPECEYPAWWRQLQDTLDSAETAFGDTQRAHLRRVDALLNGPRRLGVDATSQGGDVNAGPPDATFVRMALDDVLARDAFQDLSRAEVKREGGGEGIVRKRDDDFLEEFRETPCCDGDPNRNAAGRGNRAPASPAVFKAVAALLLAAAFALSALVIWRVLRRRRRMKALEDDGSEVAEVVDRAIEDETPGEEDALAYTHDAWNARAEQLAARGEHRLAIRALYLALLVQLHSSGALRYDTASTNLEYVDQLRRSGLFPAARLSAFDTLVDAFEQVWYGEREADGEAFARCAAWADQARTGVVAKEESR